MLATSCFSVKLLEYISCILLLNYFHVCLGIQLKGKTTYISFLRELHYHMLGQQNAFQENVIITLNISLIRRMLINKICSNCSSIVARCIIHKIHQLDSQCLFGHKLQLQASFCQMSCAMYCCVIMNNDWF